MLQDNNLFEMSLRLNRSEPLSVLYNCELDDQKYDLVNPTYTNSWIHSNKTTNNKKKNYKLTKTDNTKKIFKK